MYYYKYSIFFSISVANKLKQHEKNHFLYFEPFFCISNERKEMENYI